PLHSSPITLLLHPFPTRRSSDLAYEPINSIKVFERDGWICGICHDPIDPAVPWPDDRSKSLDHIVPMSKGGGHVWSNVQAAHLGDRKSTRLNSSHVKISYAVFCL